MNKNTVFETRNTETKKRQKGLTFSAFLQFLFVLLVITVRVLDEDKTYYMIPKYVMLAFFLATLVGIFASKKRSIFIGKGVILPVAFTLYEIISCFWAAERDTSFSQLVTQLQLFVLFFFVYLLARENNILDTFFVAIYLAGFVMIGWVLSRDGINGFLAGMEEGTRMGGFVGNQNTFGMLFSTAPIIAFYYLLKTKKKWHLVSLALFVFFALSSGSKKALVMIIVGYIGVAALFFGVKRIGKLVLWIALFIIIGRVVIELPIFSTLKERMLTYIRGDFDYSDDLRARMIASGWEMFRQKPFLGYGLSYFSVASGFDTYSHNNFIEIMVSLGGVGLVLYYLPFLRAGISLLKQVFRPASPRSKNCIVLFLLIAIEAVFGYGMVQFYTKNTWLLLGVALGYLDGKFDTGTPEEK